MNLKFGDVTARRSPTFSDCHYKKKITFSIDYCLLSRLFFGILLNTVICNYRVTISVYLWKNLAFYFVMTCLYKLLKTQFNEFIEFDERIVEKCIS